MDSYLIQRIDQCLDYDTQVSFRQVCHQFHSELPPMTIRTETLAQVLKQSKYDIAQKAIIHGFTKLVKHAISLGFDDWNSGLKWACHGGHRSLIQMMIDNGANDWNQALYGACYGGHRDLVEFAIRQGAKSFDMGLIYVAMGHHYELVRQLINSDSAVTAFNMACEAGDQDLIKELIAQGIHNWNHGLNGACLGDQIPIAQMMIELGADDLNYGLKTACEHAHQKMIDLLIKHGASDWNRGLEGACQRGHFDLVEMMITHGITDWNYGLHGACLGGHVLLCQDMIERGATDLDCLAYTNNPETIQMLVQHGANPNAGIFQACNSDEFKKLSILIQCGANDWDEGLRGACMGGHSYITEFMLQHGANPNLGLEEACQYNNPKMIKMMIQHGATTCNHCHRSIKDHQT